MTERGCVYCAVRAEYLRIIQEMLGFEMLEFRPLISAHFILFCFVYLQFRYQSYRAIVFLSSSC